MTNQGNILQLILSVLITGVFFTSGLIAQEKKIAFEKYGVAEGLPEEAVTSMVLDNQGFIWATTQNGLVKFDGYKMKVYKGSDYTLGSEKLAFVMYVALLRVKMVIYGWVLSQDKVA